MFRESWMSLSHLDTYLLVRNGAEFCTDINSYHNIIIAY